MATLEDRRTIQGGGVSDTAAGLALCSTPSHEVAVDDAPPSDPVSLYRGTVMHARLRPVSHRFSYKVVSMLIDIDRLAEANRQSKLFSTQGTGLFSFREADHGVGNGTPLRRWIDGLLQAEGALEAPQKILLLCYPRVLGYVFNPLSVYFCYAATGRLSALVYQVCNTFGERHAYVVPLSAEDRSAAGIRNERDKRLYVSPFLGMNLRYRFRIRPPARTIALRILEMEGDVPVLAATFHGERRPLTTSALGWTFSSLPFQSLKIITAIHWEAFRLWLKGVPLHKKPLHPAPAPADLSLPRK